MDSMLRDEAAACDEAPKRPIDPFYLSSHEVERERERKPFGDTTDFWTRRGPKRWNERW